jgi:general secretion pathway protein A
MYLAHFGLDKSPFSPTPDPRFLFLTARHREALAALLFAVTERKGFMVLTGDAGTGKTTLVRKLLLSIPAACAQFSVIVNPVLTRNELLETVLMDFGEAAVPASKALRLALFKTRLLGAHAAGGTSVLVIDEAHLLTEELIDEVRLLSNLETSEQKLLQIVLVGQSELNEVLARDSLRQLKQRVAIRMHIDPLQTPEVKRYLQSRWSRCTHQPLPFSEEAIGLVAVASHGIPRVVNTVSDAALINAYGAGTRAIGRGQMEEAIRDLGLSQASLPMARATTSGAVSPIATLPATPGPRVAPKSTTVPLQSLQRYLPATEKSPKFWKLASWFGTAQSGVK